MYKYFVVFNGIGFFGTADGNAQITREFEINTIEDVREVEATIKRGNTYRDIVVMDWKILSKDENDD